MIILDGSGMTDRESLHGELKKKLRLPDYYGGNLDALNDCLGERRERDLVVISRSGDFLSHCGEYGLNMLCVFAENGVQVLLD